MAYEKNNIPAPIAELKKGFPAGEFTPANALEWAMLGCGKLAAEKAYESVVKAAVKEQVEKKQEPWTPQLIQKQKKVNAKKAWKKQASAKGSTHMESVVPRTQKARGIVALRQYKHSEVPDYILLQHIDEIKHLQQKIREDFYSQTRLFIRPCPITPKHGFVDSRFVDITMDADDGINYNLFSNERVIGNIFREALRVDPDSELVIMPPIDSRINVIYTPGMMTIGPSNDGATSGVGSITIPTVSVGKDDYRLKQLVELAGVADGDAPYFELLQKKETNSLLWVQLRGGPSIEAASNQDFIPQQVVVEHVVSATGDLLEWAEKVTAFQPGTVVDHSGGNPLSHYFVHCRLHNIPILTSRSPVVGETLEPVGNTLPPPNYQAFRTGVVAGTLAKYNMADIPYSNMCHSMLFGLHNSTVLTGLYSFWLGVSVAYMLRLGLAASLGEWRHRNVAIGKQRDAVYRKCFGRYWFYRNKLPGAVHSFTGVDGSVWSSGYGGMKWADCSMSVVELDNALCSLMRADDDDAADAYVALMDKFNEVVNKAHNNGWWMNKFVESNAFDAHCTGNWEAQPKAAMEYWTAYETAMDNIAMAKEVKKWKTVKILSINPEANKVLGDYKTLGINPFKKKESSDEHDDCECPECTGEGEESAPETKSYLPLCPDITWQMYKPRDVIEAHIKFEGSSENTWYQDSDSITKECPLLSAHIQHRIIGAETYRAFDLAAPSAVRFEMTNNATLFEKSYVTSSSTSYYKCTVVKTATKWEIKYNDRVLAYVAIND